MRLGYVALATWLTAAAIRSVVFPGADWGPLFERYAHDVALALAGILCLIAAGRRSRERLAWGLVAAGIVAWTLGETYYTVVLWTVEDAPIPSPADAGYLSGPLLLLAGFAVLLRGRTASVPITLRADGITAGLAVAAVSAAIGFEAAASGASGEPLGVAVTVAYPIIDLVYLGVVVGALAGTGWRLDRTWVLLGVGALLFWAADSLYLVRTATDTYSPETWIELGWWIGLAATSYAAWQPAPDAIEEPPGEGTRIIVMPLLFGTIGLGLLIHGCFSALNPLAVGLAAAAMLAVMLRLLFTFRDHARMLHTSRDEALTDALTGLPNRRALSRRLERRMPLTSSDQPLVLALFDLDGFKLYNDTFGHPAGDALLVRLADNLRGHLDERAAAYRMGGDEFCVLLEPGDQASDQVLEGAAAALSERGEGFTITCSYGAIHLPLEASEASEALRIADQRLYTHKNGRRASASRQSRDVLLTALQERSPELTCHLQDVADLAEDVARRLELSDEEVERIRHAAELHDVGKVAIPDAILSKPGPLDEGEWEFMRRHTLIGERIVAAAPALTDVAALVRSSHERWDGTGYPDGLAGSEISLGSRIVAVADAFDAMVAYRPYAEPRRAEAALAELRACGGTQFDPVVVEVFIAAWKARERVAGAVV